MKHLLLSIALMFLVPVNPAFAKKPKGVKVHASGGKITAVSANSISVQVSKTTDTYKISAATLIHLDGRKAGAGDLKKGMHAEVTASQLDPGAASAIEASNDH